MGFRHLCESLVPLRDFYQYVPRGGVIHPRCRHSRMFGAHEPMVPIQHLRHHGWCKARNEKGAVKAPGLGLCAFSSYPGMPVCPARKDCFWEPMA
jgi:hypothetical protein